MRDEWIGACLTCLPGAPLRWHGGGDLRAPTRRTQQPGLSIPSGRLHLVSVHGSSMPLEALAHCVGSYTSNQWCQLLTSSVDYREQERQAVQRAAGNVGAALADQQGKGNTAK